jgi:hypothetical protein
LPLQAARHKSADFDGLQIVPAGKTPHENALGKLADGP